MKLDGPVWASQPDCGLKRFMLEEIISVSSSDTNEALELLTFESGCDYSRQPTLNEANVCVALTAKSSRSHVDRGGASYQFQGRSRACALKVSSVSGGEHSAW
jgi:hypothetical protein